MTVDVLNFWENTALEDMIHVQWESLCDNCGRCCLHKLEDEDTGDIYFTDVVCHYIDEQSCQCPHYEARQQLVPDCLTIDSNWGDKFNWLPSTCAYRLLHEKKPLFDWHPLISGDVETVHLAGISVRGRTFSDDEVNEKEIDLHIINWVK
ncbi:conserved hypothetical protein [Abyssogena phaseoliformis symbiont OG214]|uniref:YcgN family cysteine cluster protein n=1 Tax=Abyssogena phaseoliformis symbiont TaxID=596095 RepID=UPI001914E245|nr:YcgN family cysteine cluster protein [Abyssogena phaseoliformis symbiont]MBW5289903.1 hypothetical protein [Candidatus Ruthia sp. Apha_13_S6]BBB23167.1 conserved hypothetical protein [Abyssogena phaseoliformis symbiont OG214]